MRNLFLTIIFLFAVGFFASGVNAQDFSGIWMIENENVSFTLEVKQKGKTISGTYSYVILPDAKRIREGKFTGKIGDEIAEITFQNNEYETEKGTAQLELVTETLIWTMPENIADDLLLPASFSLEKNIKGEKK